MQKLPPDSVVARSALNELQDYVRCVTFYVSDPLENLPPDLPPCIGIDPGVYTGITFFPWYGKVLSIKLTLPSDTEYPCTDCFSIGQFLGDYLEMILSSEPTRRIPIAVIEDAAFGARFGRESLAEKRAGYMLGLIHNHRGLIWVKKIPPASVRKQVFGSAKVHATTRWPNIDDNAADSIPMAFIAARLCMTT